MSCATFTLRSTTTHIHLFIPEMISFNDIRETKKFHFWSDYDLVIDAGKDSENITIEGIQPDMITEGSSYASMTDIDDIMNCGDEITLEGTGYTDFDTTWYIENFSYTVDGGMPSIVNWSLTLEKSY